MVPLKEDVMEVYRVLLGRDPENDEIIRRMQAAHGSVLSLVLSVQGSQEYRARAAAALPPVPHAPDLALLERFRMPAKPRRGAVTDWLGVHTSKRFSAALGMLADLQEPSSLTVRDAMICGTVLTAVESAAARATADAFSVVDIGAGWGRWAVRAATAARTRGIASTTVIAAEAQPDRFAFLQEHLEANGAANARNILFQGVVAPMDAPALFPVIDAHLAEDAAPAFTSAERKADVAYETLPTMTLRALLEQHEGPIDICCVDVVRAAEIVVASLKPLASRIRHLIVGTTNRAEEAALVKALTQARFSLVQDLPSVLPTGQGAPAGPQTSAAKGLQVWQNSRP